MEIPIENLFISNIDLSRIANTPDEKQIQSIVEEKIRHFNTHPLQHELLSIRNPKLEELQMLTPIISQICENLLLENYFAAIALTNMLFEATFKYTLVHLERQPEGSKLDEIFRKSLQQYQNNGLEKNLNKCRQKGYITKEDCIRLKKLGELYRDPFSHANFSHIGEKEGYDDFPLFFINLSNPEEVSQQSVKVSQVPFFSIKRSEIYAENTAFGYFGTIMHFVNLLDEKISLSIKKETTSCG